MLHCTRELETIVGDDCMIGHLAHLEGCTVEDGALVGTGSIVLHRAIVRTGALVGAGAVVPERHGGARAARWRSACPRKLRLDAVKPDQITYPGAGVRAQLGALPRRAPPHRLSASHSVAIRRCAPTASPDAVADRERGRRQHQRATPPIAAATRCTAKGARRSRRAPPSATSATTAVSRDCGSTLGASVTASTGKIAPGGERDGRGPRGLQRLGRRDLGDAELVARVRAELVVRHELIGDEARQAGLDAAVLVDLARARAARPRRLARRAPRPRRRGRPPRRRAASSPRCTRRRPSTSRRRRGRRPRR